jgi:hypothetical protein
MSPPPTLTDLDRDELLRWLFGGTAPPAYGHSGVQIGDHEAPPSQPTLPLGEEKPTVSPSGNLGNTVPPDRANGGPA